MQLSEFLDVVVEQKKSLEEQEPGLLREMLVDLPGTNKHALVVTGIRRCGKSTLLRQFVTKKRGKKEARPYFYLNFDDIRLTEFSAFDFSLIDAAIAANKSLSNGKGVLFFDEIQSAPHWELYVRQKLDEGFQVLITGSNASLLSRELGSRLTGRHISKELFPFSYEEFCAFKKLAAGPKSLLSYLDKGGFPEYLKTENTEVLTQLQSDIIYRDIAVRYGIRNASALRRLFVYLVSNPAQPLSPAKLIAVADVKSPTTVLEYLSYFESAYLIELLPCFSWSVKAQSLSAKKSFVVDFGLLKTSSLSFSPNYGALLENFIYNRLRQKINAHNTQKDLYYFHAKNGRECDFIVSPHGKPACIQVCWKLTRENKEREIQGLLEAMNFFDVKTGTIITHNTEDIIQSGGKKITVLPAWQYVC